MRRLKNDTLTKSCFNHCMILTCFNTMWCVRYMFSMRQNICQRHFLDWGDCGAMQQPYCCYILFIPYFLSPFTWIPWSETWKMESCSYVEISKGKNHKSFITLFMTLIRHQVMEFSLINYSAPQSQVVVGLSVYYKSKQIRSFNFTRQHCSIHILSITRKARGFICWSIFIRRQCDYYSH